MQNESPPPTHHPPPLVEHHCPRRVYVAVPTKDFITGAIQAFMLLRTFSAPVHTPQGTKSITFTQHTEHSTPGLDSVLG